jgi:NhaC family Na+:H+ antiporter
MQERKKKKVKLIHALISIVAMAILISGAVVVLGADPQVPLVFGCLVAGLVAVWVGFSWDEILDGMLNGITQSLEAILILLLIGCLVGTWIVAGTVPTMIYFGLKIISAKYFLFATMLICSIVAFAIGSWGTIGTVGLAFMGIGLALGIPAPLVAGCIVSGAYFGEVISPLSDATNLTAAVVGGNVFNVMRKVMGLALVAFIITELIYLVSGFQYGGGDVSQLSKNITPLLDSLGATFHISVIALLPMIIMVVCILIQFPAIPSMLMGIISGMIIAALMQGVSFGAMIKACYAGYISNTGKELLDKLLTAGGMSSMMYTISIIIIAMAFGGIMQRTGQMRALIRPIVKHIHCYGGMNALTIVSCIGMNVLLPDQYLGISVPGQMYTEEYDNRGFSREDLAVGLLGGGAVSSPLIPWNTCGIYCMSILGVGAMQYASYAYYDLIMPVVVIIGGFVLSKQFIQPDAPNASGSETIKQ